MPATTLTRRTPRLLLLLAGLAPAPAFAQATFQVIQDLPDGFDSGIVYAVSDDGSVAVGWASTSFGIYQVANEAFRWTQATGTVGIRRNDQEWTGANAVSADGSVIVGEVSLGNLPGDRHPFRWTAFEGITPFDDLPGEPISGWATAVSADGSVIAGQGRSTNGPEAFRWTQATGTVGLGDLPGGVFSSAATGISADGSVIVGNGTVGWGRPFRWTAATGMVNLGTLAGGEDANARATAVSADGRVIIGHGTNSTGPGAEAWRWTQETGIVGLGDLPGGLHAGVPKGVSGDGSIIVGSSNIGFGTAAFIWDAQRGMRNLRQVLIDEHGLGPALQGVTLADAVDISADGRVIVGWGSVNGPGVSWIVHLPAPPAACYPNCDASTEPPALNVQDFSCFLTRYAAADPWSNCDQSTQPPTLNVQDFSCFLTRYAAGCP